MLMCLGEQDQYRAISMVLIARIFAWTLMPVPQMTTNIHLGVDRIDAVCLQYGILLLIVHTVNNIQLSNTKTRLCCRWRAIRMVKNGELKPAPTNIYKT